MIKNARHDRKTARQYSGQEFADAALRCLNLAFAHKGHERLAHQVRERVTKLFEEMKKVFAAPLNEELNPFLPVNRILGEYPIYQRFVRDEGTARGWSIDRSIKARSFPRKAKSLDENLIRGLEAIAAHGLVWIANANMLDRIQVCQCGQWYFARFAHQRFCSERCRETFWESSEERKEKKRQRARENYLYKKAHPSRIQRGK
jgi:hypothetical protein